MATPCEEKGTMARSGADDVASPRTILPTDDVTSPKTILPTDDVTSPETALPTDDVTSSETALPIDDVTSPETVLPIDDVRSSETALPTDGVRSSETALPTDDVRSPETALPIDDVTSPETALPIDDVTSPETALPIDDVISPETALLTDDVISPETALPTDGVRSPETTLPDNDVRKSTAASDPQKSTEDNEPIIQPYNVTGRDIQGGEQFLDMGKVFRSQPQDSETSFMQANSQVVVDSERSRCVQTDDLEEASDILQETGRVILCGFPGTGKTTVGHALLRRCRKEGFKPYILSKLEDWHAHIGPGRRSFVLIDGLMGVVRVNRQQYEEWTKILRNMLELIKAGDCRVVVTLYPHVLHELQQLETDSQSPLLDSSAVVRLMKEDLDTEVKRELLDFHLKQLPLQPSQQQEVVERIVQADTSGPAFLWCCRYLVDHWQAVEDPATVFTSPAEANSVLLKQMCLHETHGDSFAAVLALAMLGKGRFLHRKTGVQSELKKLGFKEYCDDHLSEYEAILLGSVLSEKDNGFNSRVLYDAACLALGRSFRLPTLLGVCDVTFLVQCVHVTLTGGTIKVLVGSGSFKSLARKSITVAEDCQSLTKRLYTEIRQGRLPEACQHTALQCPEFLTKLEEYCKHQNSNPKQLVGVVDTEHKLPLLYWSALNEQHIMTDWCLGMLDLANKADLKFLSPKIVLGLSLLSNWTHKTKCIANQCLFRKLMSPKNFKFSEIKLCLPHRHSAACFHNMMTGGESEMQQLNFLYNMSLPIPSTLIEAKVSNDTVTVQVRDRGDWYLALRLLADREVDETDRDGNTLLHIAADKGNLEAITLAVKSGASLTKTNNKGLTPYQLAQRRTKALNNATGTENAVFDLFTAIRGGNDVTVKTLLCNGSSVDDKDKEGRTGLFVACKEGQGNIADLLIDLGVDVNVTVTSQWLGHKTPLFFACQTGLIRTVELLLKHNAVIDAISKWKQTALHCACQCKSPTASADITRLLLDAGADVNARAAWGRTPLHCAAYSGNTETLRRLIHHEADLNATDYEGRTPLHRAYTASKPGIIISQLVEAGAETGRVHQAVVRGDVDALMTLLQQGADVNQHDTSMGCSPLHAACLMGRTDIVTWLTQRGAKVNAVDDRKTTPLHIACQTGAADIATCLTKHGAKVNAVDNMKKTPLHHACHTDVADIVTFLTKHGAHIDAVDHRKKTPLHHACHTGVADIVTYLTQHGAKVIAVDDMKRTPLHYVCAAGQTHAARQLIDKGAAVNARDNSQSTPLRKAAADKGNSEIVVCLLEHGAQVNAAADFHITPLHIACEKGHTETAECLLQHGANVNAVSEWNETPLHIACENGHTETAQCLLQREADVNAVSEWNETPLHTACKNGHTQTAQCLLQHKADLNVLSKLNETPLHTACKNGHTETAQCLLHHAANVNVLSQLYVTPLHTACENGHTETAQCLLQHGANVNNVAGLLGTPLDVARNKLQHCDDLVTLLVQHGAVSRHQVKRTT